MAVNEEERNMEAADPQSDIPTVVPAKSPEPAANEWKMPEPVFRQTSGYLPRGFEKRFPISDADTTAAAAPPPPPADPFTQTFVGAPGMSFSALAKEEPVNRAAEIEPQPDVAEVALRDDEPAEPPAEKQRSQTARIVVAVILFVAAVVFIAVFLAVVYYLFLAPYFDLPTLE